MIALSVVVILATSLGYLHAPSLPKAESTELAAESPPVPTAISNASRPPAAAPLTQAFRSPTKHYAVRFPPGWTVTPATKIWHGEWAKSGDPNVDALTGSSVVFTGTSEPLVTGQSPANWIDRYFAFAEANHCRVYEYMDFLGLVGMIDLSGCSSTNTPGHIYASAVVVGGRGYRFSMEGKADYALFVSMLRTISFGP